MPTHEFRQEAAALWHWVANICRNPEFADLAKQSTDTLLHPGFVGPKFEPTGTGTLVIGMNPGGGGDTAHMGERQTLIDVRDSPAVEAFDHLNAVASQIFLSWSLWRNNLRLLLDAAGVDPMSVAYVHAVPFRVHDNAHLTRIYVDGWHRVTSKQIALLRPGRIILAGKTVGEKLRPLMPVKARIVPRTIGDSRRADTVPAIAAAHQTMIQDEEFWA